MNKVDYTERIKKFIIVYIYTDEKKKHLSRNNNNNLLILLYTGAQLYTTTLVVWWRSGVTCADFKNVEKQFYYSSYCSKRFSFLCPLICAIKYQLHVIAYRLDYNVIMREIIFFFPP